MPDEEVKVIVACPTCGQKLRCDAGGAGQCPKCGTRVEFPESIYAADPELNRLALEELAAKAHAHSRPMRDDDDDDEDEDEDESPKKKRKKKKKKGKKKEKKKGGPLKIILIVILVLVLLGGLVFGGLMVKNMLFPSEPAPAEGGDAPAEGGEAPAEGGEGGDSAAAALREMLVL